MYSFIYLASQSPRRQELLHQMGVQFELLLPVSQKDAEALEIPQTNEDPKVYVQRVTLAKCAAALKRWQMLKTSQPTMTWAPILCADTTVSLLKDSKAEILAKPQNEADAKRILGLLSGKSHHVMTAVAIQINQDSQPVTALQISSVEFSKLSEQQIQRYINSGEHAGKAGAYGIQGLASTFIKQIQGSHSGIMGLPLYETAQLLIQAEVKFTLNPHK
ncbi:MAG: septum formation protein Maf [Polynucleobacter sp.]|nr:septum formation protein Maf [Polynucleobacter sp.]